MFNQEQAIRRLYSRIRSVEPKDHEAKIREFILGSAGRSNRTMGVVATLLVRVAWSTDEEGFARFLLTGQIPAVKLSGIEFEFVRTGEWRSWHMELNRSEPQSWISQWNLPLDLVAEYWDDTLSKYNRKKAA